MQIDIRNVLSIQKNETKILNLFLGTKKLLAAPAFLKIHTTSEENKISFFFEKKVSFGEK